MNLSKIYEALIENRYFTEDELNLVTNVAGFNEEIINRCIYSRYGYNSYDQLIKEG